MTPGEDRPVGPKASIAGSAPDLQAEYPRMAGEEMPGSQIAIDG